jgi:CheY-specific phosphatase CheX
MGNLTMQIFGLDEKLVNTIIKSARDGLAMAGLKPVPSGVSKYFHTTANLSAIIGFVGPYCGSVMCNAEEEIACFMAGRMVGVEYESLTSEAMDGFCEITNIIAGQTKAILSATDYKFDRISVPSVVVGSNYFVSSYKGMESLTVHFDLPELEISVRNEPNFSVSMSLMKV